MDVSPLERGFKGCVTVRGAAWVEGIAGYSFEKLGVARWYLSASVTAFDLSGSAWTSHTPDPSPEGRFRHLFLVRNGEVMWGDLRYSFLFDNK